MGGWFFGFFLPWALTLGIVYITSRLWKKHVNKDRE